VPARAARKHQQLLLAQTIVWFGFMAADAARRHWSMMPPSAQWAGSGVCFRSFGDTDHPHGQGGNQN
jgi:hypothetical protein